MRDMLAEKFERCCRYLGFSPVPQDLAFVSDEDGLRVEAVVERRDFGGTRINRRATLERLVAARKGRTEEAGGDGNTRDERAALQSPAATSDTNERAPGAVTPRAPKDQSRLGE